MQLDRLINDLSRPAAYPGPPRHVEVRQTHISVVFLAGDEVYKVKKPVNLGFVDFSTLERRRHFCEEEVRLNRRLAPGVYKGVVPVTQGDGGLRFGGDGEPVEWAVHMERLPDEATLEQRLFRGEVNGDAIRELARSVAGFHARAERGPRISAFGRFEAVAANVRGNFQKPLPGVSEKAIERVERLFENALERLRGVVEARAARGVPCDTHGDLRLDHVYLFPDGAAGERLVIIDCIEFNDRFRFADPVADMAFLFMDLGYQGRRDLARAFADAYFEASGDAQGRELLPLYSAYRAAVRGKVEGLKALQPEVSEPRRDQALQEARGHWLMALGELEQPSRRPALVLVGGLPGTGKSTLARGLAETAGFRIIRSDVVRKELAGIPPGQSGRQAFGEGMYTTEWTDRTYVECALRAAGPLREGERVLVDATFSRRAWRDSFLKAARRLGVRTLFMVCTADPEVVRRRLEGRVGDASDADWDIYQRASKRWEEPVAGAVEIRTDGTEGEALAAALAALREAGLAE